MKELLQNSSCKATFFICLFAASLISQENKPCQAGIYKTRGDLEKNKVSHLINTGKEGYGFGFQFPADMRLTIKITTPDSVIEFKPGTVYGYTKCGKRYRYYPGGDLLAQEDFYGIEEIGGLVIYSSVFISGDEKFYSLDLSSPIHRLSLKNLEADFENEPTFLKAVTDLEKEGLSGLTAQDEKGGYKINKVYREKVRSKKSG